MKKSKDYFLNLYDQWREETAICSFVNTRNPVWARLVGFGKDALPWIFELIVADGGWGLFALVREISGEDIPIRPEDRGRIDPIRHTFIAWGRTRGYLGAKRKLAPEVVG